MLFEDVIAGYSVADHGMTFQDRFVSSFQMEPSLTARAGNLTRRASHGAFFSAEVGHWLLDCRTSCGFRAEAAGSKGEPALRD